MSGGATLVCPVCERRHEPEKRFCDSCGTPLTYLGADVVQGPVSASHERARKVDPRFTEGELVREELGFDQHGQRHDRRPMPRCRQQPSRR